MIQVLEEEGLTVTTLDMKAQPTRRLGRQSDLVSIEGPLRDGARLLTLTGPAGVGKMRLAVGMGRRVSGEYGPDGSATAQRKLGRDYRESPYGIQR